MRRVAAFARLVAVVACIGSAAGASAQRFDGVAALVGGRTPGPHVTLILRSDVELRALLSLAASSPETPRAPFPAPLLAATLDQLLGEVLVAREAERLRAEAPSESTIARHRADLAQSVGGEARLVQLQRAFDFGEDELHAIATRRALVDAFLRANLEGVARVTDAEVDNAYAAGGHPFADRPLDEVRETLRAWLASQALQRDVARWIEVLRARAVVRVIEPYVDAETRP